MEEVRRIFVEKKEPYAVEAKGLLADWRHNLGIKGLTGVRLLNRYDVAGLDTEAFEAAIAQVFSEPQIDAVYRETLPETEGRVFAVEYLPGQYDQRADSAAQCVQILTREERPLVRNARVIVLSGDLSEGDVEKIKAYYINPVEAREASLERPKSLEMEAEIPADIAPVEGFTSMDEKALSALLKEYGFAMDLDDLKFCQSYFKNEEHRDPSVTEMRMIDTYWSDHCRHTTFSTVIDAVEVAKDALSQRILSVYEEYIASREALGREQKPVCLMDIATIGAKELKAQGLLKDLDESEEINACSIVTDVEIDGKKEEWLVMFKNETHNHPTEIEPFGGAATCLGGAIRDPLSGRTYVYQAMRVTGSGDPTVSVKDTLPGKLPQRKISKTAAQGYSSYGNQIGLATGLVREIYHPGYVAKRMEIGAVVGAAPRENVRRERPADGDIIILLGGRTGRDGCGGATGSSKAHSQESLTSCGAEVQKGNPPEERKLQRLFRNPEVTRMIKRCNDFGAGGVSVAIGELADGLKIDLDKVPKKYDGLDGTELAISESQERMAVVVSAEDAERFMALSAEENLEATAVAKVTKEPRLTMTWRGKKIVDIHRTFLNSNGAPKHAEVKIETKKDADFFQKKEANSFKDTLLTKLSDLNGCSQKGLSERFDASIGAGTVLMPFGGRTQKTPTAAMVAKIPVLRGETPTGTVMAYGFDPYLSEKSPFLGAVYAVVSSVAKVVAAGGDASKIWLTFQEYFERLGDDPKKWGRPFEALLGAYLAQVRLKMAAIGGKDSMSGTFENLTVPPTLVSFAIAVMDDVKNAVSQEFKEAGSRVVYLPVKRDADALPDFEALLQAYENIYKLVKAGKVLSAYALEAGGAAEAVAKMAFGNEIGFAFSENFPKEDLFFPDYGGIILELSEGAELSGAVLLGQTTAEKAISYQNEKASLEEALWAFEGTLRKVYPEKAEAVSDTRPPMISYEGALRAVYSLKIARPRVLIPVFPGTNCEYDTARAFEKAGARTDVLVMRNLTAGDIEASVAELEKQIRGSQIVMLPGGFSGGDEPDGSGKFIATAFRSPGVKDAVTELLKARDGLMLGICNGFQALIKLGLVPFGEIREMDDTCPTLTYNTIGRHVSQMVDTRIASSLSAWFSNVKVGDVHTIAVSHGEGRFIASEEMLESLKANGQIATQYVDLSGAPTYDGAFNPNGSAWAIEGITSPDGRVLGKMGHSERLGSSIAKNVPGEKDQKLFEAGVAYFQ